MKLSIYTYVRDGIHLDFHTEKMIRHHLPFADELVINEGYSTDGTLKLIQSIESPKIVIIRNRWNADQNQMPLKDAARRRCTGDWCIGLDSDEFIPEWEWQPIRDYLDRTARVIVPLRLTNFYGNFRVYHSNPRKVRWPLDQYKIHRNRPDVEFWGDASNVRIAGQPPERLVEESPMFECHHFGMVRNPARLREKWRKQGRQRGVRTWRSRVALPRLFYSLWPHDWFDEQFLSDLAIYDKPPLRAVRQNPEEFVRDDFRLFDYLKSRGAASPVARSASD